MNRRLPGFTDHAMRRATRRFGNYKLSEIWQDFNSSEMLYQHDGTTDKFVLAGKIANYVVNDKATVITMLPIPNKYKKKCSR